MEEDVSESCDEAAATERGHGSRVFPDGTATEHARPDRTATEHVIAAWQARFWHNSKECQHLIELLLSLRANAIHGDSQLQQILVHQLPPFFTPTHDHALLALARRLAMERCSNKRQYSDMSASEQHIL